MPELKDWLADCRLLLVFGVGSDLRGDDAAGLIAVEKLSKFTSAKLKTLSGGPAPENLTGEIKRINPSHLIMIDSADMNEKPGATRQIEKDQAGGYSFSTHTLPLKIMIAYLLKFISPKILIIGIQPKSIEFGAEVSREVLRAVDGLVISIKNGII